MTKDQLIDEQLRKVQADPAYALLTEKQQRMLAETSICWDDFGAQPTKTVKIEIPGRKAALESTRVLAPDELKDAVRALTTKFTGKDV